MEISASCLQHIGTISVPAVSLVGGRTGDWIGFILKWSPEPERKEEKKEQETIRSLPSFAVTLYLVADSELLTETKSICRGVTLIGRR